MPINPKVVGFLAIVLLAGCGGGSGSSPKQTPQFYLPLAVGNNWSYDCGNQVTIADTVTQTVNVNGQQTFALQLQFPNAASQTFLLANDAQGNVTLYGYLVNGAAQSVTPTVYISANPKAQQKFDYPAQGGGTVPRYFFGFEPTNPTPLGTFQVASYDDNGAQDIWGYALGKGVMEQDHGTFDCKITAYQLH